jgi:hypothetical protein
MAAKITKIESRINKFTCFYVEMQLIFAFTAKTLKKYGIIK